MRYHKGEKHQWENKMSLRLYVIFHGSGSAFYRMMGCPCPRCLPPELPESPSPQDYTDLLAWSNQAHTSASLLIEADGRIVDHTLIDCGMGVVDNIVALPTPARGQPINRVLITHGHLDHVIGLDPLVHGLRAATKAGDLTATQQPSPLPIYCTRKTWSNCIAENPDKPAESGFLRHIQKHLHHVDITDAARSLDNIVLHPALRAVPVPVEHFHDSVNYVFEFFPSGTIDDGDPIRIALCWDLMAYPNGRTQDVWSDILLDPFAEPMTELMSNLDLLAIEMTTWKASRIGHISFEDTTYWRTDAPLGYGAKSLIQAWRPRQTRIVHYSGWDDRLMPDKTWVQGEEAFRNRDPLRGPVSDGDLRIALRLALGPDLPVDVAQPGETLLCE
jgi:Beta-lactamase superfamily domain